MDRHSSAQPLDWTLTTGARSARISSQDDLAAPTKTSDRPAWPPQVRPQTRRNRQARAWPPARSRDIGLPMSSTPTRADEPAIETGADAGSTAPALTFADFNVHPDIVEALAAAGIVHPFPIQAMTLPVALDGHDIIGQAKTGTGKTLGFGVPMIQRVVR